ncbi:hypothetical protein FGA82_29070 [Pseudomonas fluorescens]|uniref:hypothetical protein n=1 Tax=Pseudomonas fluorescens TaxID=294 RepID=UPI00113117F1|nr:hypothetical protein [Pseudomonas fluorescens]TMU69922.1 hypothetical protein FGA82_29070 [Pseudomonas fluorescens]
MSPINTIEQEFVGQPITDEELAVQLDNCLQHRDPELLSQIARSVVHSHFPQITHEPPQEKSLFRVPISLAWQRGVTSLSADIRMRLDSCLDLLRQRRDARRH